MRSRKILGGLNGFVNSAVLGSASVVGEDKRLRAMEYNWIAMGINQRYERHAKERFIRPDEIAELAFYLMSDYCEIICGHTVVADSGDNEATL